MAQDTLKGLKVAILVTDGFEKVELTEPRKALDEAGAETRIVSRSLIGSAAGILRIGTRSSPST